MSTSKADPKKSKKITEKSLKETAWKSASASVIAKAKARNSALKLEKDKKDAKFTT